MITDNQGNVYMAGLSADTGAMDDILIIKYDQDGDQIWIHRYNSVSNRYDVRIMFHFTSTGK